MRLFEMDYIVDFRDVDRKLFIRPQAMMEILGKVSTHHEIEGMGLEANYMSRRNMAWILYQWKYVINEPKKYARKLSFKTFLELEKGMYVYRYFRIMDGDRTIGHGLAHWVAIDFSNRKIARIPEDLKDLLEEGELDENLREEMMCAFDTGAMRFRLNEEDFVHRTPVQYSDIDMNIHVTNAVYGRWALEALHASDPTILEDFYPYRVETVYKKEKTPDGYVDIRVRRNGEEVLFEILDEGGTVLNLVKFQLKRRDELTDKE